MITCDHCGLKGFGHWISGDKIYGEQTFARFWQRWLKLKPGERRFICLECFFK